MKTPKHIAIIMDGNGRWAKKRGLPRTLGHREGIKSIRKVLETAEKQDISHITLYAFSSENWQRPQEEVDELMKLLRTYLKKETANFVENGIKLRTIGDIQKLPLDIQELIYNSTEQTKGKDELNLTIALSYGGRDEIIRAIQKLENVEQITEEEFEKYLDTVDLPPVDLLIRTGGEKRISNFLLWQSAYAELYFTETLWPDFSNKDLIEAIEEFKNRERRFGK